MLGTFDLAACGKVLRTGISSAVRATIPTLHSSRSVFGFAVQLLPEGLSEEEDADVESALEAAEPNESGHDSEGLLEVGLAICCAILTELYL